jgi:hypothetical protein
MADRFAGDCTRIAAVAGSNGVFYNYKLCYLTPRLNGSHGHSAPPGFELNVFAMAGCVVPAWNTSLDGVHISSSEVLASDYEAVHAGVAPGYAIGLIFISRPHISPTR